MPAGRAPSSRPAPIFRSEDEAVLRKLPDLVDQIYDAGPILRCEMTS
ncbi:hypothetical protein SAMN05216330_102748 [Bradyrhizobium sp. Ghvi]|nr:hypothetical protein SAMN05216330_102748 [Bradyrhizobium sp. Ghvi]